jgi:hypothetical protein
LARPGEQAANLTLGIVREFVQPVVGNVRLDNAISASLGGFEVDAQ